MISIQYVYNRNKKSITKNSADFTLTAIEKDTHKLFGFGNRPLMFYYFDKEDCKTLFLNDENVDDLCKEAQSKPPPSKIFLDLQEKVISEIGDLKILERVFTKKYLYNQQKIGQYSKKHLIIDIHSLKESLQKTHFKNNQIKKLLLEISKNIKSHFVDECFNDSQMDMSVAQQSNDSTFIDHENYSSILEKRTESSFFSGPEFVYHVDSIPNDLMRKKQNNPDITADQKVICVLCTVDVTDEIRFVCQTCEQFAFCEECNQRAKHKHPMPPTFVINDSKTEKRNAKKDLVLYTQSFISVF